MKTLRNLSIFALAGVLAFGTSSCAKDDLESPNLMTPQPNQSMKVRMTDNPGNYEALDVEITSIAAFNNTTGNWIELNGDVQMVSVLELTNGNETELAFSNNLEVGTYTKLRIEFSQNNELTLNSTASASVGSSVINIGVDAGLTSVWNETVEIMIDEQISTSSSANILVDFNVAESVIDLGGSFVLDPVITVVEDEETGVFGSIENDTRAALEFESDANASTTYSAYTNENGEFMLRGMADGNYTLTIMPDQDEDASLNSSYTYSGVVVVDGEITAMGEIDLQ